MPEERLTQQEAIESIVVSLEDAAESIGSIGDFFATLDRALQNHADSERMNPASFLRAYRKAAEQLEAESQEAENGDQGA